MPCQQLNQLATFFLGGAIEIWRTVKMDEGEAASALHHAVRGYRRIEAAGYERHNAPAAAHRKSAGARDLVEGEKSAFRQDLDVDGQCRMLEVYARPGLILYRGPK